METIMELFLKLLITILAFGGGVIISAILLSSVHSKRNEERHTLINKEILEPYLEKLKRRRLVFSFILIASIISGSLLTFYFNGKADAHAGTFSGFGDAICVVLTLIQFGFVIGSSTTVLICNQKDIKKVREIIKCVQK